MNAPLFSLLLDTMYFFQTSMEMYNQPISISEQPKVQSAVSVQVYTCPSRDWFCSQSSMLLSKLLCLNTVESVQVLKYARGEWQSFSKVSLKSHVEAD